MRVIGKNGKEFEAGEEGVVEDGCALRVPSSFMDADEEAAIADLKRRHPRAKTAEDWDAVIAACDAKIAKLEAEIAELEADDGDGDDDAHDADGPQLSATQAAEKRRQDAYEAFRRRIDTSGPNRRSAWEAPYTARSAAATVRDPSWKTLARMPGNARNPVVEMGGTDDGDDGKDAADAAAKAYSARSVRLRDAWKENRKRKAAGPWLPNGEQKMDAKPAWASGDGSNMPAAGGGGSPRRANVSDGEAAWLKRNEELSKAYLANRKPFVPTPGDAGDAQ